MGVDTNGSEDRDIMDLATSPGSDNYIRVDTDTFSQLQNHVQAISDMSGVLYMYMHTSSVCYM